MGLTYHLLVWQIVFKKLLSIILCKTISKNTCLFVFFIFVLKIIVSISICFPHFCSIISLFKIWVFRPLCSIGFVLDILVDLVLWSWVRMDCGLRMGWEE